MTPIEHIKPMDIEKNSFSIIAQELAERKIVLTEENAPVIMRVIHTTADFEYASTLAFSDDCIKNACGLLKNGAHIVTDTNMALAGINKKALASLGGEAHCFMACDDIAQEAKARGVTRAYVSMEHAFAIDAPLIFAVGNAPTALISLCELMDKGMFPKMVIGVPVGFVNVVASKELLEQKCIDNNIPFIINRGRKGGSNIAAAICNALIYMENESRS